MVPVIWLSYQSNVPQRYYWDHSLMNDLLTHKLWRLPIDIAHYDDHEAFQRGEIPDVPGAIVFLPGRAHMDPHHVRRLNADLSKFQWVILMVCEDEDNMFPVGAVKHPNIRIWVQTPWPGRNPPDTRFLPLGYATGCREKLRAIGLPEKDLHWSFCGQVTHSRRQQCAEVLRKLPCPGLLLETSAFGTGYTYDEYLHVLARSRVAPCPSGNVNVESFRLYEALEAGALPVADGRAPRPDFSRGYWQLIHPDFPFPVVENWDEFKHELPGLAGWYPEGSFFSRAWWMRRKRMLINSLLDDLVSVGAINRPDDIADQITVLIPTSPVPSHPSTALLDETLASVRAQPGLNRAEIIIMLDGVREAEKHRTQDYYAYVERVLWNCAHEWWNVVPYFSPKHGHQVTLTRAVLPYVTTPYVLFMEHDTPLCGEIPWWDVLRGMAHFDLIRFLPEPDVHPEHQHLMRESGVYGGLPVLRTNQWSQRPHVAHTEFYKRIVWDHFSIDACTFIEDKMHGVVQSDPERFLLGIYNPEGNKKRSYHTDGRAGENKFEDELVF